MSSMEGYTLVTGANRGLGNEIFKSFVLDGNPTVGTARSDEAVADLDAFAACNGFKEGDAAGGVHLDLSDPLDVASQYDAIVERYGVPRVIINNAAIKNDGPFLRQDAETTGQVIDVDARSPIEIMRAGAQKMKKIEGATILNILSVAGHVGSPNQVDYVMGKAALGEGARSVSRELVHRKTGAVQVQVTNLSLGMMPVGMEDDTPEEAVEAILRLTNSRAPIPVDVAIGAMKNIIGSPELHGMTVHLNDRIFKENGVDGHIHYAVFAFEKSLRERAEREGTQVALLEA